MRKEATITPAPKVPTVFTIHVGASVAREWSEWLGAADILSREDGTSLITTKVRDQAMLLGLLIRIRDLGIPLLGLYPASDSHLRPHTHAIDQEETP